MSPGRIERWTSEKRPAFEAYVARLVARPAALRAGAIDDALLDAMGAPKPPA